VDVISFLRKRLIASLTAILLVTVVVFILARMQGDPRVLYTDENLSQETYDALGRELGLDRPLYYQYWVFISKVARGDLGVSIHQRRPVFDIVLERLPATLKLAAAGFLFSLVVGVPLGILSAVKRGTVWDIAGRAFAVFGHSLPSFWVGIMGIFIFSVTLGWLPPFGDGGISHYVLPAVALGWAAAGGQMRLVRSAMLETLDSQYVVLARAKGVSRRRVIFKHALSNALLAPLTFAGLTLGGLITGAIIIETVFAWPGLGLLAINAVNASDYAVLQGVMIFITFFYIAVSFVVDVIYGWVDPRIRYE
jgi:peptide/nickel transport system permease protein